MNASSEPPPDSQQLPLFSSEESPTAAPPSRPEITRRSSLSVALGLFDHYMGDRGFTENTHQAFRLDMQLLSEYLGAGTALEEINTVNLTAFLSWMLGPRGVPCSPKTLERRITTLKVFFGWLAEEGILLRDPAAPLTHRAVSAPLSEILMDEQLEAVLAVTQRMRQGDEEHKPDARPHLLVTLLLATGVKKGECVKIALNHLDVTDAAHPVLWIRYRKPDRQHKERRIPLPAHWGSLLQEYMQAYKPRQYLFPWTARNLEYVLTRVAEEAGISHLTFEMLRWTCAVRDYVEGMDRNALRQKLGLSTISWYEVEPKLALLAQQLGNRKMRMDEDITV
ncbi:MAG: tyrosine-type recombinase/integrase [Anaerolineae bacterium]|nr:tyrosine-type recombinase/integrase [Anaerolineae bacterium]